MIHCKHGNVWVGTCFAGIQAIMMGMRILLEVYQQNLGYGIGYSDGRK